VTPPPAWLPGMQDCSGVWADVVVILFAVFDNDFRSASPRFQGLPIWWDRRIEIGEKYEEGFWHLITRDDPLAGRVPDFRRAERLPWCQPTLRHDTEPEVSIWSYKEGGGQIRTYVWLRDFDYVVILQRRSTRRGDVMVLVTAYYVDGPSSRRSLDRKRVNREP
jgi:hypothetical protein